MTRYFILVFAFVFSVNCFAQSTMYQFAHLSNGEGLSQSSVIAIHQDRLGQIWIGTRDGLNKYDGSKFTVYRNQEDNTSSISNNDILSIHEGDDGFLWVGTYNGLNKYDPKTDKFTRYFHNEKSTSLCNNTIWTIQTLSNGKVWIGTSGGLSVYDKETDSFDNYLNKLDRPVLKRIMSVLETSTGDVFVGTGEGIRKVLNPKAFSIELNILKGSEAFYVQDLAEGLNGNILIATRNNSVIDYDQTANTFLPYLDSVHIGANNDKNVRKLLFDNHNKLWIGTYNGLKIIGKDKSVVTLRADIANEKGLSKNSIKSLFKDKKGSVWIGTYYGGINIWDETNINFRSITQNQKGKGLNYSVVSSIENYGSLIFFGTEGGGVNVWNKLSNTFSYIEKDNSKLIENNIKSLKILNDKLLWIGTFNSGLEVYNLQIHQFEKNVLPKPLLEILNETGVYAVEKDTAENIWIGTFGKGLIKYNENSKMYKRFYTSVDGVNTLSSNLVRAICSDSKGNVWVSTEKGLNKIDRHEAITSFFYDEKLDYGDDVLCVYEDVLGHIWTGTKSKGLYRYDGNSFRYVELSIDDIKISSVHSILEDDKNQLLLSTNQGIVMYNYKNNTAKIYNQTDGLISDEFNNNASLKIGNSQFYFGGPRGATYFNSNKLTTNNYAPNVTDVNNISVGDVVELQLFNKDGKQGEIISELYKNTDVKVGSHHWDFPDLPLVKQQVEVTSIRANTITIKSPLTIDIKASYKAQLVAWKHLKEVGIEHFKIKFPKSPRIAHHIEQGYNGIYLTRVFNSWVNNIVIEDADSGVLSEEIANITISNIVTKGEKIAHYTVAMSGTYNVLAKEIKVYNKAVHPLSFNTLATKCVYMDCEVFVDPILDQHSGANHQNLFDNVKVHLSPYKDSSYPLFTGGGAGYWKPSHGAFSTFWNIRVNILDGLENKTPVLLNGMNDGPHARIIGISGNHQFKVSYGPESYIESVNKAIESVPSLYKYQLNKRLSEYLCK